MVISSQALTSRHSLVSLPSCNTTVQHRTQYFLGASLSVRSRQHSPPQEVETRTDNPDANQDRSLYRREHRASRDNEAADEREKPWNEDEWLNRSVQLGFSEPQDDSTEHSEEEEGVFCESVQSEQNAHIAQQNVYCRDNEVEDKGVAVTCQFDATQDLEIETYIGDSPLSIASSAFPSSFTLPFVTLYVPIWPTVPNAVGNQFLFAAATVMRPATKELPSAEPAMTRQISAVAT